jgi:hypothetical protein
MSHGHGATAAHPDWAHNCNLPRVDRAPSADVAREVLARGKRQMNYTRNYAKI